MKIIKQAIALVVSFSILILSSCSNNDENSNYQTLSFKESNVNVTIDQKINLEYDTTLSIDELTITLEDESIGEVSIQENYLEFTPFKIGTTVLTLSNIEKTISDSIYIRVTDEEHVIDYELELNLDNIKREYLLGETIDTSNLEVYCYQVIDGVRENIPLIVTDYIVDVEEMDGFETLGTKIVDVSTVLFGNASYSIEVKNEITTKELSLNLNNVARRFVKGSIFSRQGLVVNEISTIKRKESIDQDIIIEQEINELSTSEYQITPGVNEVLDSNGWFDVIVKANESGLIASYPIIVYQDSDAFIDTAYNFINTKNIGLNIYSNFPTLDNPNGLNLSYSYKRDYFTITSFNKDNLNDYSKDEVLSIKGGMKDKNNRLLSFELDENNNFIDCSLVKKDLINNESYWDYLVYFDLGTFKDFDINSFPNVTTSDDGKSVYQRVEQVDGMEDYENLLSYFPIISSSFKLANLDEYYFRFVKGYEISVNQDNNLAISIDFSNLGNLTIETITQALNIDNEFILDAIKNYDFSFNTTIDDNLNRIKEGILLDNYIRTVPNGMLTYYYNKDYVYYDYDLLNNPSLILAGISPFGIVRVKDSTKGFEDGIYQIFGSLSNNNFTFNIDNPYVLVTTNTSYIDNFKNYLEAALSSYSSTFGVISSYLSLYTDSLFNDNETYGTFNLVSGTTNFYLSNNADLGSLFMSYISGGTINETMLSEGYCLAGMVPTFTNNSLSSLYLYAVDKGLYGYGANLTGFGTVNFTNINEYFGI